MDRTLTIVNICPYPVRVMVGTDPETGLETFRAIKALGRLGPIDIDSYTYEIIKQNPSIRLIVNS